MNIYVAPEDTRFGVACGSDDDPETGLMVVPVPADVREGVAVDVQPNLGTYDPQRNLKFKSSNYILESNDGSV